MEITAPNGQHWVQDEPIVDWLRKNGIKSYYISFRPGREHNAHKSASLANNGMLIPKETFTFLGLTGYGEQMLKEFRNALLEGKEGGLIGKILDNADGLSCNVYNTRQRLERSCDCSPSDLLSKEALQKYPEQRIAYLFVHCESKSSQDVKLKRGFEELS